MARPIKEGLDYFPLDVDIDQDDKIALIEASHGLIGFAVIIKMFMKIYDNSYFYKWGEKEQLLFSKRVNVDINSLNDIINDCVKWDVFSKKLYEEYKILTSKGIQKRYLEAAARRKEVRIKREYLLLSSKEVNAYRNLVIVDINSHPDKEMLEENPQSKVKESKVKESKVEENINQSTATNDAIVFYQNNFGLIRPLIAEEMLDWINDLGDELVIEAMKRAIDRNKASWGYAKSILQSWHEKGIRTIEQAKAEEIEYRNQHRPKPKRVEVVPDWFRERNNKTSKNKKEVIDKDLAALLKKHASDGG